jgi:hypothetical protein
MKRLSSLLLVLSLGGCMATVEGDRRTRGGGGATFSLQLPLLLPPLIVVSPGVSVASDLDEEVFYADGYYWARQDRSWYRARDHRGAWVRVADESVPGAFARSPPGRYRHYRSEEPQGPGRGLHDRDWREDGGG